MNVQKFYIQFDSNLASDDQSIGLRNIQIYVNTCYPTCATCSGSNFNECLTCYYGSPTLGQCSCHPNHQFAQTCIGCRQECPRDYFTSDSNYICVPDRRITQKYQYLQGRSVYSNASPKYSPFIFIPYKTRSLTNGLAFYCNSGPDFIGYFYFNEGASLQIPTISALTFIRLRVTFYILQLSEGSKILMKLDSATCAEVMKTSTGYTFNNAINIFTDTLDCPPILTRIRIETILRTQLLQPELVMEGQLQNGEESWGFYNVTIDAGVCSEHCSVCSSFSTCQLCESGYVLYQHGCVSSCPAYSQNCIDYSVEYPYSRYLAKGFYDINMTLEDVNTFYDSVTNAATNFKTGQQFSFFPDKFVLGGVMVWNNAAYIKTFSISQPHYAVTIRFNMTFGDEYSGEFYYFIDSISYGPFTKPSSDVQNLVGKSEVERTSFIYIYFNPQTSTSLNLKLECKNTGSLDLRDGFCAISEYFIVVHYCPPFCDACTSSSECTIWQSGHTSSSCSSGQYLSFNQQTSTYSCEACRPDCQTCNSWDECTSCSNHSCCLSNNICYCYNISKPQSFKIKCQCQLGYYYDGYTLSCKPVCGDRMVVDGEDCDDGNLSPFDGCSNCNYQCHKQCSFCKDGQCLECQEFGWSLNQITNTCETTCGDGIVTGLEQCDDQNSISDDGCDECIYLCPKNCKICKQGKCLDCDEHFELDLDKQHCIPICGDKFTVVDQEECDDEECTECNKGICYECDTFGWKIFDHICSPICGDRYVIAEFEQCDDGNEQQYDGCYECQYQCEQKCTTCLLGICYECNNLGWEIVDHKCRPHCGDGLVLGYEQCDDMNDFINDGCDQCKFVCDDYCVDCYEGICMECELGRYTNMNICQTECGDGYYVQFAEQCDDGNDENHDGCDSNCKIETDWVCINSVGHVSSCYYSQSPEFDLTLLPVNAIDIEEVQLTFTQPIKRSSTLIGDILNSVTAQIPALESSLYAIDKQLDQPILSQEVTKAIITFTIHFYIPVEKPILEIEFINDPVISEHNQTLKVNNQAIVLATPGILSQNSQRIAESAQAFNKIVIYSLIGLTSLCMFTGSTDLFWNLMDQLQYLSYIKYINIEFPSNVNIYFEVFKLVTISPIITALGVDKIFAHLDGEKEYVIETSNKFLIDGVNAYFFINFQSFIFYFISTFLMYQITKQGYLLLYRIRPCTPCRLNFFVSKIYDKLMRISKEQAKSFYYNGLLRIMMSSCYDLSFSAAIQLYYYKKGDYVLTINYYLAIVVCVAQFGLPLFLIGVIQKFTRKTTIQKPIKYKALFEDVIPRKNIWILYYNAILLVQKQLFIFIIVFMQQDGKLQTLSIALLQALFLAYMLFNQPLKNRYEFYKSVITESIIIFNAITFIIYAHRVELSLTLEQNILLGWIHIFSSTMILGVSLLFDFIQQFKIILPKIKQILPKKQKKQLQMLPMERIL